MSTVVLCDICEKPAGLLRARVVVASPEHPHKGEPVGGDPAIDVCTTCLKAIPDLSTSRTLEHLRRCAANVKL